ncbi:hypothetical protein [Algibacter lectus]|nr:hypothetical protein [Algibacter lectus]
MKTDILKDKFLQPLLITLCYSFFYIGKSNDMVFFGILFLIMLTVFFIVHYFKADLYIQNFSIVNNALEIRYQRNLSKNDVKSFLTHSKTIKSFSFNSKSFLDTSHNISIKYIDEDGLHLKKIFKTNNDDTFTSIIHHLKNEKKQSHFL